MNRLAIFASGTGSNFDVIVKNIKNGYIKNAEVVLMVCDKENAAVIKKAEKENINIFVFNPKSYDSKDDYEKDIIDICQKHNVDLIVLAGYMRILSSRLLGAFPDKIINIHPSLLPAFKGKDAVGQAIDYGVKVMGVSVHYVNEMMDGGKIIAQKAFEVKEGSSRKEIETEIHAIEHKLYSEVIKKILEES